MSSTRKRTDIHIVGPTYVSITQSRLVLVLRSWHRPHSLEMPMTIIKGFVNEQLGIFCIIFWRIYLFLFDVYESMYVHYVPTQGVQRDSLFLKLERWMVVSYPVGSRNHSPKALNALNRWAISPAQNYEFFIKKTDYAYAHVSLWTWTQGPTEVRRGSWILRTGVTEICESPDMNAGKFIWLLLKINMALCCWATHPAP